MLTEKINELMTIGELTAFKILVVDDLPTMSDPNSSCEPFLQITLLDSVTKKPIEGTQVQKTGSITNEAVAFPVLAKPEDVIKIGLYNKKGPDGASNQALGEVSVCVSAFAMDKPMRFLLELAPQICTEHARRKCQHALSVLVPQTRA